MSEAQKNLVLTLESLVSDLMVVCEKISIVQINGETFVSVNNRDYKLDLHEGKYFLSSDSADIGVERFVSIIAKQYKRADWKKYGKIIENSGICFEAFYLNVQEKIKLL